MTIIRLHMLFLFPIIMQKLNEFYTFFSPNYIPLLELAKELLLRIFVQIFPSEGQEC